MPSIFLKNYLLELTGIINIIDAKESESLVGELASAYEKQSKIFICGNGGMLKDTAQKYLTINSFNNLALRNAVVQCKTKVLNL